MVPTRSLAKPNFQRCTTPQWDPRKAVIKDSLSVRSCELEKLFLGRSYLKEKKNMLVYCTLVVLWIFQKTLIILSLDIINFLSYVGNITHKYGVKIALATLEMMKSICASVYQRLSFIYKNFIIDFPYFSFRGISNKVNFKYDKSLWKKSNSPTNVSQISLKKFCALFSFRDNFGTFFCQEISNFGLGRW